VTVDSPKDGKSAIVYLAGIIKTEKIIKKL
jgi:hypothetical protein